MFRTSCAISTLPACGLVWAVFTDGLRRCFSGHRGQRVQYDVMSICESCLGGLLAVDGRTGGELWRHYSPHEVFAVNCNQDLTADSVPDCIVAGRVGVRIACRFSASISHPSDFR